MVRQSLSALRSSLLIILGNLGDEISTRVHKLILSLHQDWIWLVERVSGLSTCPARQRDTYQRLPENVQLNTYEQQPVHAFGLVLAISRSVDEWQVQDLSPFAAQRVNSHIAGRS